MSALTVTLGADITTLKRAGPGHRRVGSPTRKLHSADGRDSHRGDPTEKILECAATEPNLVLYGDRWALLTAEALENSGIRCNPQPQRGV
jgi:hypothetical protein